MLATAIFSVIALAATALANGATILAALNTAESDADQIVKTARGWTGDKAGFENIRIQVSNILGDIDNAYKTASQSAPMDTDEAAHIPDAMGRLGYKVTSMLANLENIKRKCDDLKVSAQIDATHLILVNIQEQRKAMSNLISMVIANVLSDKQKNAIHSNTDDLDQLYAWSILCYDGSKPCPRNGLGS